MRKLVCVTPHGDGVKTRLLDKVALRLAEQPRGNLEHRAFFDFRRGECDCWGLSPSLHSPFFCPADHSARALPQGRLIWHGGIFYANRPLGFQGLGMGGAGDSAGGYLGGSNQNIPFKSARQEAYDAVFDLRRAELLPGGLSAIDNIPPPPLPPEPDLEELIDLNTGRLKNIASYPVGLDGEPIVPRALRRRILAAGRLVGGGRPGFISDQRRVQTAAERVRVNAKYVRPTTTGRTFGLAKRNGGQQTFSNILQAFRQLPGLSEVAVAGGDLTGDASGPITLSNILDQMSSLQSYLAESEALVGDRPDTGGTLSDLLGLDSGFAALMNLRGIDEEQGEGAPANGDGAGAEAGVSSVFGNAGVAFTDDGVPDLRLMNMAQLSAAMTGQPAGAPTRTDLRPSRAARRLQRLRDLRKAVAEGHLSVNDILRANDVDQQRAATVDACDHKEVEEDTPATPSAAPAEAKKPSAPPPPAAKKPAAVKAPPGKKPPPPPPKSGPPKKKAPPVKRQAVAATSSKSGKRLRKMPWEPLTSIEGTQFPEIASVAVEVDPKQVELDFSLARKEEVAAGEPQKQKREVIKVLPDQKRAYTMSIATARITKIGFDKLRQAINLLDADVLTPDACATLIEYAPRPDEIAAVQAFVDNGGDIAQCDSSDQFVYALKDIKNMKGKLEAHAFALSFATELEELSEPVEKLRAACINLRQAKRLPRFLYLVIRIGNVVNETNVRGIKLTSLPKLAEYKTTTKPVRNLLQYIVELILGGAENAPTEATAAAINAVAPAEALEALDLLEELKPLADGAKVDLEGMEQRVKQFGGQLRKVTAEVQRLAESDSIVEANLKPFVSAANDQIKGLETAIQETREEFLAAAHYYGESDESIKKLSTPAYLNLPLRLARELQSIVKDIREKQARAAKRRAAAAAPPAAKKPAAKAPRPPAPKAEEVDIKVKEGAMGGD